MRTPERAPGRAPLGPLERALDDVESKSSLILACYHECRNLQATLPTRICLCGYFRWASVLFGGLPFFSVGCRSFRWTSVSLARLLASLAVSFLFVWAYLCTTVGLPFFSSDCRFSSAVARFARWTAVLFVGLLLGPFKKTYPGSSLGRRGVREDPFAGLRPELFVGLPFFSMDFRFSSAVARFARWVHPFRLGLPLHDCWTAVLFVGLPFL